MAIRGDNNPPSSKGRGSITQAADSKLDRIGNISNVSKTVANMQKDVKQRITETKRQVETSGEISAVQNSMVKVLEKLEGTVTTLSSGVKSVTIDTAKATKDLISDYGKALSADININKQKTVAMALAQSTPIYGYFVSKFMETDVFKKAAERIKQTIGGAFKGLSNVFRGGKAKQEKIPHMAKGGVVKKEGVAKLHAAEVVMPVDKLLDRMDETTSVTRDLVKIMNKVSLSAATSNKAVQNMIAHPEDIAFGGKGKKRNIFQDFFKIWGQEQERHKESIDRRILRELIAIREEMGAEHEMWPEVFSQLLDKHPVFRNISSLGKVAFEIHSFLTWKPLYALVKTRGGYKGDLSSKESPLAAMNENIGILYSGSMWRYDNMLNLLGAIVESTRDTASYITGKKYKTLKGIPNREWSILGGLSKILGKGIGGAMMMAGKIPGLGMLKKAGKGIWNSKLLWMSGRDEWAQEGTDLGSKGKKGKAHGRSAVAMLSVISTQLDESYDLMAECCDKKEKRDVKVLEIREEWRKKYLPKQLRDLDKISEDGDKRTSILQKVRKALSLKNIWMFLILAGGFLKKTFTSMISGIWDNTIGKTAIGAALGQLPELLNKKTIGKVKDLFSEKNMKALKGFMFSKKGIGAMGTLGSAAWMGYDAYKGVQQAKEWGTSKTSAGLGAALGGTGSGLQGALAGVAKGGMLGASIGSIFPGIGTAIGGAIGAIAGGILGFVGGKRLATGFDYIGKQIKRAVLAVKETVMMPFKYLGEIKDLMFEKFSWKNVGKIAGKVRDLIWYMVTFPHRIIKDLLKEFAPNLYTKLENAYNWIADTVDEYLISPLKTSWKWAADLTNEYVISPLQKAWKWAFDLANEYIISPLKTSWKWITDMAKKYVITPLTDTWNEVQESTGTTMTDIITFPSRKFQEFRTWLFGVDKDESIFSWKSLKHLVKGIFIEWPWWGLKKIRSILYNIADLFIDMDTLSEMFKEDIDYITSLPGNLIDKGIKYIKDLTGWDKLKEKFKGPIDTIKSIGDWIADLFINLKNSLLDTISGIPGLGFLKKDKEDKEIKKKVKKENESYWQKFKNALYDESEDGTIKSSLDWIKDSISNITGRSFSGGVSDYKGAPVAPGSRLGSLSSKYESGAKGGSAVGWDTRGGTSYGTYQIASKTGTMDSFLNFAKSKNPEVYKRLKSSGSYNAGTSGRFAQEWRSLANEGKIQPLEHEFIKRTHYDVAYNKLKPEIKDMVKANPTLQDVLWSSAVHHGPGGAPSIFNSAFKKGMTAEEFIKSIYSKRTNYLGKLSPNERTSVMNRLKSEYKDALATVNARKAAIAREGKTPGVNKKNMIATSTQLRLAESKMLSDELGGKIDASGNKIASSNQAGANVVAQTVNSASQTFVNSSNSTVAGGGGGRSGSSDSVEFFERLVASGNYG